MAKLSKEQIRLLKVRRIIKSKKPEFRHFAWRTKLKLRRLGWRRPRGRHNKWRLRIGGKWSGMYHPSPAFSSPKLVRGLHPSGYEEVLVYNVKGLEKIDPERQAARIASCVGLKKRLQIEEKAKELNIVILNPTKR